MSAASASVSIRGPVGTGLHTGDLGRLDAEGFLHLLDHTLDAAEDGSPVGGWTDCRCHPAHSTTVTSRYLRMAGARPHGRRRAPGGRQSYVLDALTVADVSALGCPAAVMAGVWLGAVVLERVVPLLAVVAIVIAAVLVGAGMLEVTAASRRLWTSATGLSWIALSGLLFYGTVRMIGTGISMLT